MKLLFNSIVFAAPGWLLLLSELGWQDDVSEAKLAKVTDVTYSHVHKMVLALKKKGLVVQERVAREHRVRLTERGRKAVSGIRELSKAMEEGEV